MGLDKKHKHEWKSDGYGRDDFDLEGFYCECGRKKDYDTVKKKWIYSKCLIYTFKN